MSEARSDFSPQSRWLRGEEMKVPDEVAVMLRLKALGWGVRRIATELGCSHMTVRRCLDQGGWVGFQAARRSKALDGLEEWLAGRMPTWSGRSCWPNGREPADGGAGRGPSAPRARGRGAGDGALRDPAGAADADRLRATAGDDRRRGLSCSWPRSATRAGPMCGPSATSVRPPGSRAWRVPFGPLVGCRPRCCSTTPAPWSSGTTRRHARWSKLDAFAKAFDPGPARRTGRGPRARACPRAGKAGPVG